MSDANARRVTPLSELIVAHAASGWPERIRFLEAFRKSHLGVVAVGIPAGAAGEFVATTDRPVSVRLTRHTGGRPMALAFAVFAARFARPYHKEGDRWYGKTKAGKFMTETDAIKAGYHASKEGAPKDDTAKK